MRLLLLLQGDPYSGLNTIGRSRTNRWPGTSLLLLLVLYSSIALLLLRQLALL
jgi:hypothetical protein